MKNLVRSNRRSERQRGVTLVELALGLGVASIAMAGLTQLMLDNAALARGKAAADRLNEVVDASNAYIKANWNAILTTANAGAPLVIPAGKATATGAVPPGPGGLPSLQGGRFLSESFVDTNPWGQRHALLIRQPAPNKVEAMVVTYGGSTIPDQFLAKIPPMVGGKGGAMLSAPLTGTVGQVTGLMGGWQTAASTWSSGWGAGTTTPSVGHIMATLGYDVQGATAPYLYRDDVGDPTLNRMNTAIDMGGHDLNNANAVNSTTVTTSSHASIGGNLTVASGYAYVSSATVVGDLSVGGNQEIAGGLQVHQDAIVDGDVYGREFYLSSMGNQPLSKAMFGGGAYAPGSTVPKPTCKSGQTPRIFVMPAHFSDNGTGSPLASAQAWAENQDASNWIVRLRVRTETGWITPDSNYGLVIAFSKCS